MITTKNANRKFKLGMHTYTLHLSGLGESWGFQSEGRTYEFEKVINLDKLMDMCVEEGIEVIHMTLVDLDDDLSDEHLAAVKAKAEKAGPGSRAEHLVQRAVRPARQLHDRGFSGNRAQARLQAGQVLDRRRASAPDLPLLYVPRGHGTDGEDRHGLQAQHPDHREYNLKIAIENHCDLFADEVIWMVEQLNHPLIGACCDTINSLMLAEGIKDCIDKMAPYCYCVHFCDNRVFADPDGTHSLGCAIGDGDVDGDRGHENPAPRKRRKSSTTIDLEIELPLSGYTIEDGRKEEIDAMRKSIKYMHEVLDIGIKGR